MKNSQVSHWHHSLEANIAFRLENSRTSSATIRRFRAYLIRRRLGVLVSRVEVQATVIDVQNNGTTINMHTGLTISSGISSLYYLRCYLSPFRREEQNLQVVMETLAQKDQVIEIVPDWKMIIHNQLAQNTVSRVRYL